jgi:hypothetical protein
VFDVLLTRQKGIHGLVQLVFGGTGNSQDFSEGRGGRLGGERPGEGELRSGRDQTVSDQRFLEVPLPGPPGSQKRGQSRRAHRSDHGRHVAVRQGADAGEVLG